MTMSVILHSPMSILQKHSKNIFHFMKRHRSIPENIRLKRTFTTRPKKQNSNRKAFNTCTGGKKYILKKKKNQSYLSTPVCSVWFGTSISKQKFAKKVTKINKDRREMESDSNYEQINNFPKTGVLSFSPLVYIMMNRVKGLFLTLTLRLLLIHFRANVKMCQCSICISSISILSAY